MKKTFQLSCLILLLSASLVLISHFFLEHSSLKILMQAMQDHYWLMTTWRYLVYGAVVVFWPYLISKWGDYKKWPIETINHLSNQRVNICLLLIIIEVLFVYNLLGHLLTWL